MSEVVFPSRYCNRQEARTLFGDDADRYARFYLEGDPIADRLVAWIEGAGEPAKAQVERAIAGGVGSVDAPPLELREFFERAERLPAWVDFEQIEKAHSHINASGSSACSF